MKCSRCRRPLYALRDGFQEDVTSIRQAQWLATSCCTSGGAVSTRHCGQLDVCSGSRNDIWWWGRVLGGEGGGGGGGGDEKYQNGQSWGAHISLCPFLL